MDSYWHANDKQPEVNPNQFSNGGEVLGEGAGLVSCLLREDRGNPKLYKSIHLEK